MRAVLATAGLIVAAPLWNLATAEAREAVCNPYSDYVALLYEQGEIPMMAGLEEDGLRVEVWVNQDTGSFSFLLVDPRLKTACFLSYGERAYIVDLSDLGGE